MMPLARIADNLNIVRLKYELEHLRQNNSFGEHSGILAPGQCKQRLLMVLQQSYLSLSYLYILISPSHHRSVAEARTVLLALKAKNSTRYVQILPTHQKNYNCYSTLKLM